MIGEVKEIIILEEIFEIKKGGVSNALEAQGLFNSILVASGVNTSKNTDDKDFAMKMVAGLTEDNLEKIKKVIIRHVSIPKLDNKSYENLDFKLIIPLFMDIYSFHVENALKKNTKLSESEGIPILEPELKNSKN